ncbi:uncharacterized protein FSUBG_9605 [Fusarium subglutinans]|uniref:Uncharacterized protein n=1 Tax=Gibberella subglutinans TaxID=42677 RepID=A0A8H5UP05_GIBSU|nr:uncharacterized protein FSUBG_9605 [Fusarium subglutinans]KAF5594032.1 hypothetical protein FSUBG_9605 [Fusarium subglutinans]
MRFSLQSLAICFVSIQAHLALASPCKPLTTTTALAAITTTTAITDDSTTTAAGAGETTSATLGEATTTTAIYDLSTTLTLSEGSTTTALVEESTTTTLAEDTTTTAITAEPTTTTFEATATTAAETTTTTEALEGTQLSAIFVDNTEKDTYVDKWGSIYSVPQTGGSISKARFELEPETNRVFTHLVDGTKVYLFTVIPGGNNYAFMFDTAENIDQYPAIYHYVQCTAGANNILSCASEVGPTPIVWYWVANGARYYGNSNPNFNMYPLVTFKLG